MIDDVVHVVGIGHLLDSLVWTYQLERTLAVAVGGVNDFDWANDHRSVVAFR